MSKYENAKAVAWRNGGEEWHVNYREARGNNFTGITAVVRPEELAGFDEVVVLEEFPAIPAARLLAQQVEGAEVFKLKWDADGHMMDTWFIAINPSEPKLRYAMGLAALAFHPDKNGWAVEDIAAMYNLDHIHWQAIKYSAWEEE